MNVLRFSFLITFLAIIFVAGRSYAEPVAMEDLPVVKLQALDKSTARTVTFQAKVGSTIQYGSLFIKTQSCRKAPPLEKPESAAFLQVWEVPIGKEKSEWIFSGWMFASSPALSAMDHPVYDVWVLDCLSDEKENKEAKESKAKEKTADPAALEAVEGDVVEEKQEDGDKNIDDVLNEVTEEAVE
tara:strand:- start:13 stop:567 length:555 start_codon:yes stop_codon:yes gene_type:complete